MPVKVDFEKVVLWSSPPFIIPLIIWDLIKSRSGSFHSDSRFPCVCLYNSSPHTFSLLSLHGLHTSRFSIPATKPQQQGGNDPATMAVMMESAGGLAGSLTLPNKSPNNSVNIRADPTTRSNTLTHDRPPHMTLSNLSVRQENYCWPVHCVLGFLQRMFHTSLWTQILAQNTVATVATITATQNVLILLSCIHSLTICLVDRNLWKAFLLKKAIPRLLLALCLLRYSQCNKGFCLMSLGSTQAPTARCGTVFLVLIACVQWWAFDMFRVKVLGSQGWWFAMFPWRTWLFITDYVN